MAEVSKSQTVTYGLSGKLDQLARTKVMDVPGVLLKSECFYFFRVKLNIIPRSSA